MWEWSKKKGEIRWTNKGFLRVIVLQFVMQDVVDCNMCTCSGNSTQERAVKDLQAFQWANPGPRRASPTRPKRNPAQETKARVSPMGPVGRPIQEKELNIIY